MANINKILTTLAHDLMESTNYDAELDDESLSFVKNAEDQIDAQLQQERERVEKLKYYFEDILELLLLRGCDYDTETLEEYPRVRLARLFLEELEAEDDQTTKAN